MKFRVFVCLCFFCAACHAGELRLKLGLGHGDISLPNNLMILDDTVGEDMTNITTHVGYMTNTNFVFDIGLTLATDDYLFSADDHLDFISREMLFGYKINIDQVYIEPRIGYSDWDMELKEGQLLNPGPELALNRSGTNGFFIFSSGYQFTDTFGLSLSYRHQDFDENELRSITVSADLSF